MHHLVSVEHAIYVQLIALNPALNKDQTSKNRHNYSEKQSFFFSKWIQYASVHCKHCMTYVVFMTCAQYIRTLLQHYFMRRREVNICLPCPDHSHCQDFDVHDLLSELPARSGVELKGSIIIFQKPGGIDSVIVAQIVSRQHMEERCSRHFTCTLIKMCRLDFEKKEKKKSVGLLGDTWQKGWDSGGVTYKDMETLGHFHPILFISWFLSWLCWAQNNNTSHIFTDLIDLMATLMVWLWHTGLKGGSLKRRTTSIPVHSLLEGYSSVLWPSCSDKIYPCVIQCIRAIMWCHVGRLHYYTGDLLVHRADKHIHRCACKHLIINKRPFLFYIDTCIRASYWNGNVNPKRKT